MMLSRALARVRIARGERPSFIAAYAPVAFDAACVVFAFVILYRPFQALVDTFDASVWAIVTALLALGFIPAQAVLIFSSLWAAKSRFTDTDIPDE